jgi:origin recognition complex subunit 6
MPAIRKLVKAFDFPSAAPHVFTGVESTLPLLARMSTATTESSSKRPRRATTTSASTTDLSDCRVKGLIAVIFLYVFTRMNNVEVVPEEYTVWRRAVMDTLLAVPTAEEIAYEDLSSEAEELMPMAKAEGWLDMEWFMNVDPLEDNADTMEGVEMTPASNKTSMAKTGRSDYIGLGTMMQDATDYLGHRQREEFQRWKVQVMAVVCQANRPGAYMKST